MKKEDNPIFLQYYELEYQKLTKFNLHPMNFRDILKKMAKSQLETGMFLSAQKTKHPENPIIQMNRDHNGLKAIKLGFLDELKEEWVKLEKIYKEESNRIIDKIVEDCTKEEMKSDFPKLEEELIKCLHSANILLEQMTLSQLVFFKSVKLYASWYEKLQE